MSDVIAMWARELELDPVPSEQEIVEWFHGNQGSEPFFDALWELFDGPHSAGATKERIVVRILPDDSDTAERLHLEDVDARWKASASNGENPVLALLRDYADRPRPVDPDKRTDSRIVPSMRTPKEGPTDRDMRQLTTFNLGPRQPALPLFGDAQTNSVPILDVCDRKGIPVMSRGKGAPLAMRFFIAVLLSIPVSERGRGMISMRLSIRELRDAIYPNGWNAGRQWPKLLAVMKEADGYAVPFEGRMYSMVKLTNWPEAKPPDLDDHVTIAVVLPRGTGGGPMIDFQATNRLSIESGPKWRAAIAARVLAHMPGRTRLPPIRKGMPWTYSTNPNLYPVVTAHDRRRLAFGEHESGREGRNHTNAEVDAAWADLPGVVVVDRNARDQFGNRGWRIMPVEAAGPDAGSGRE